MFKRLIWWTTGAVMGAGGSFWAKRKVKRVVATAIADAKDAMHPLNIALAGKERVQHAIAEGRKASHDREFELRSKLADPHTGLPQLEQAVRRTRSVANPAVEHVAQVELINPTADRVNESANQRGFRPTERTRQRLAHVRSTRRNRRG